jgi:hypothetical protein
MGRHLFRMPGRELAFRVIAAPLHQYTARFPSYIDIFAGYFRVSFHARPLHHIEKTVNTGLLSEKCG